MPRLLFVIPLILVFATVMIGGHWYIAERVVLSAGLSPELERIGVWAIALLAATLILQPIAERTLQRPASLFVAWPASLWMGMAFYLFLLVAFSDLAILLVGLVSSDVAQAAQSPGGEPSALAQVRAAGVALLALGFVAAGLRGGLSSPALAEVEVWLARWPQALDGFTIAQISDVHIGPIRGRGFAQELTERVNALEADVAVVTGDLVDGSVAKVGPEAEPFSAMHARFGKYFITGNHDHYSGADKWCDRMVELGFRALRNERVTIERDGASFELAGVDDHRSGMEMGTGGEDLDAALADLPEARAVVLLAHDPSTFKEASEMGIDLQISGHTHGGQIWPFAYFVRLAVPFVAGLYRRGDAQVYVSRGTGFWGPPMRLFAPAEITRIRLRSGVAPTSQAVHTS